MTAADKLEGETKGGVKVVGVGLTGGASIEAKNSTVSRVRFNVPMVLPGLRIIPREEKLKEDTQRANNASAARGRGPRYFSATEW